MNKHTFTVDDSNFESEVLEADVPVLVEVSATYCAPCRALAPVLEAIAAEAQGAYRVGVLNVDESPEIGRKLAVRAVPTLIAFSGGRETARRTGVVGAEIVRGMVRGAAQATAGS
jgi:thioredoxin 1